MRIKRIQVHNFRCFEDEAFELDNAMTLVIGNNAKGKTALLEALAVALGGYVNGIPAPTSKAVNKSKYTRTLERPDIRRFFSGKEVITEERASKCSIAVKAILEGGEGAAVEMAWKREHNGERANNAGAAKIKLLASEWYQQSLSNDFTLPVIAYYGTGRLSTGQRDSMAVAKANAALAYYYCLKPDAQNKTFVRWIEHMAGIQEQRGKPLKILRAVLNVIPRILPGSSHAYFSKEYSELVIEFDDGRFFPFSDLSDGQRSLVSLTADLAVRCAHLNQHLGESAPAKTPGVVLIDEIDLFVHPGWQRTILDRLRQTFPQVQFVITTHSPFILQSLGKGRVINLDHLNDQDRHPNLEKELSVEDITEEVMGIEGVQRSERFQCQVRLAERYYRLLDEGMEPESDTIQQLEQQLDDIEAEFGDNPAWVALLKTERRARLNRKVE
jgi:predicted ATP-binding protein involved in virulence